MAVLLMAGPEPLGPVRLRHHSEETSTTSQPRCQPITASPQTPLYALCWTGSDQPSALFDRTTAWLIAHKVLLPGVTTLGRSIARVRVRATQRLWRQMLAGVTVDQMERLEALLVTPDGRRQSPLNRLRDGPVLQSAAELARAVARLDEVRLLAAGLPRTDRPPRTRVLALARFAEAAKASGVARLPDDRRLATLIAFIRTLEATAQDDVLDLFDIVVTQIFTDAQKAGHAAWMRGLRDLDTTALTLRQSWGVLLEQGEGDLRAVSGDDEDGTWPLAERVGEAAKICLQLAPRVPHRAGLKEKAGAAPVIDEIGRLHRRMPAC